MWTQGSIDGQQKIPACLILLSHKLTATPKFPRLGQTFSVNLDVQVGSSTCRSTCRLIYLPHWLLLLLPRSFLRLVSYSHYISMLRTSGQQLLQLNLLAGWLIYLLHRRQLEHFPRLTKPSHYIQMYMWAAANPCNSTCWTCHHGHWLLLLESFLRLVKYSRCI